MMLCLENIHKRFCLKAYWKARKIEYIYRDFYIKDFVFFLLNFLMVSQTNDLIVLFFIARGPNISVAIWLARKLYHMVYGEKTLKSLVA